MNVAFSTVASLLKIAVFRTASISTDTKCVNNYNMHVYYVTLRYITLCYVTLHYVTLRYVMLRCVTLRCVALRCVVLRYITFLEGDSISSTEFTDTHQHSLAHSKRGSSPTSSRACPRQCLPTQVSARTSRNRRNRR